MIIAIDCDDVLINASEYIVDTYNKMYGTSVSLENAHQSKNPEWEADRDVVFDRLHDIQNSEEYARITPHADTRRVIKHLASRHELHIITARSDKILSVTERMVDDYFPGCFVSIEHVGPDASKGEVCHRINADLMIDDNAKHLIDAKEWDVKHQIWFGNYPWQTTQDVSEIDARRCLDWNEVEKEVGRLST